MKDKPTSTGEPWMNTADLASYLRCPTREAAARWAQRNGLKPAVRRGRTLLFLKHDVDRHLAAITVALQGAK